MRRWLVGFALGGLAFAQGPAPAPPSMAVIGPSWDAANATTSSPVDSDRMWLDLLPQARGETTLVGGTIRKLDHVRDSVTVHVFGGRDLSILFDDRTHFYRDGLAASASDFRIGDRVYVDTALAGSDIFARSVRVLTQSANGQSNGQVQSYDVGSRELVLRDSLASEPATFRLAPNATVLRDGQSAAATELRPGCLVSLKFNPSATGPGVIREISILAQPGATFVFAGRISHLDLHTGLIVLVDPRDSKSYDIHFNPVKTAVEDQLREGGDITVTTTFDGTHYTANSIVINPAPVK